MIFIITSTLLKEGAEEVDGAKFIKPGLLKRGIPGRQHYMLRA